MLRVATSAYSSLVVCLLVGCGSGGGASSASTGAIIAPPTAIAAAPFSSRIQSVSVTTNTNLGMFNGVSYTRLAGTVNGAVDAREAIAGLAARANGQTQVSYSAQFEIVAPLAGGRQNQLVIVEAENRGSALSLGTVNEVPVGGPPSSATYPPGIGNGFLQKNGISYARVQWQTGIAAGVPPSAQGIGLAIVRDFARWLAGRSAQPTGGSTVVAAPYTTLVLVGISQSAWFVDDFVAEGFNVDPIASKGVFDGAIAIDGAGNWLAINNLEAHLSGNETPYLDAHETPLTPSEMLSRPATDPTFVDVANYTDFYRVFAGLSEGGAAPAGYHRYDWPTPHAAGPLSAIPAVVAGCNGGVPVILNPIGYGPYLRALVLGLAHDLGVATSASGLPPNATFSLIAASPASSDINLPNGVPVPVPAVDDNQMPVGGVPFPDALVPLGIPGTVALPPVVSSSIDATCGNYSELTPLTSAQLTARYGSKAAYLASYDARLQPLIAAGYVLAADEPAMLARAGTVFDTYAAQ